MKCYYEVLDVPRDADESTIKSSYKKLALRWHPDKNLNDPDNAKEQFQLVQQAYDVLSDRQERAWYDNHREQILRGSNKDYEDNCLDVFQYFTSACYKGFGDDDLGFYAIYRNVFEHIAKEDLEYMDNKDEFCKIPMFGRSESDYEATVRPFYTYWMSYSTKRSYVWLDPYDIKETRERRVVKLIEKENKKVRSKAKKERNEQVRNLVAFVRKRDKRVQANAKLMEQKTKENKQRADDMAKQARRERRAEMVSEMEVQGEWSKFDNLKDELETIEKQLVEEFDDQDVDSEEIEDDLYCVACNKLFKTAKAFANHESSKKHRENVERLKEEMLLDDEEEFETIDEEEISLDDEDEVKINGNLDESEILNATLEDGSALEEDENISKIKKKQKKKAKMMQKLSDDNGEFLDQLENERKGKSGNTATKVDFGTLEDQAGAGQEENDEETTTNNVQQKKLKRRKDKKDKTVTNAKAKSKKEVVTAAGDIDIAHTCVTCKCVFASKNKLFEHLKKTGHGVYIDKGTLNGNTKGKSKKNKREERRRANSLSDD